MEAHVYQRFPGKAEHYLDPGRAFKKTQTPMPLPAEILEWIPFDIKTYVAALLIPSIMKRIESYSLALELHNELASKMKGMNDLDRR